MKKSRILITMGDPSGIGPEILSKVISDSRVLSFYDISIVGNKIPLLKHSGITDIPEQVIFYEDKKYTGKDFPIGKTNAESGGASISYIESAVKLLKSGKADAMCTCPISKKSIQLAGFDYKGHTDFLAYLTKAERYSMMLLCDTMKVVLVTTHIPVKEISDSLSKNKVLRTIEHAHYAGRLFGCHTPRIAVSGLNPHSGEEGVLGNEELEIITPAIKEAGGKGIRVSGPFPADTLFIKNNLQKFDFFIAMYHDQGLIPLKMNCFSEAVNVTLNLPIIRTSVDHGTAFEIAGKNIAKQSSLIKAIETADLMVKNAEVN